MQNFEVIKNDVQITSVDIAELTGKQHKHVMRDIKNEIERLGEINEPIFGLVNYTDKKGEKRPCYSMGKKGAMQLALKYDPVTRYKVIEKIEELESRAQIPSNLSPQLQLLISLELEQKQIKAEITEQKKEIQDMRDVIKLDTTSWRKEAKNLITKIALARGGYQYIRETNTEIYKHLNERYRVDLKIRLTNKRKRMAYEGICKSKQNKVTIVDIIAEDRKLIEGYITIIKELAIKNKVA